MTYPAKFRKQAQYLRKRDDLTLAETAERFGVGVASLARWEKNPEPAKTRNKPATKIDMQALAKDLEENPDSFLHERAEKFSVSKSGMFSAVKRLGFTRKKSLQHPKTDEAARIEFVEKIKRYESEGKPIVYTDESGFSHEAIRSHGYAKCGQPCPDIFNWGAKGRTNVIGGLLQGVLINIFLFQTNIDAEIFHHWVVQGLLPKIPIGSVIVMDNASFHKRDDIRQAIENVGSILEFLPPYSPDLNPIEHQWATLKSIRVKNRCSIHEIFTF